MRDSLKKLKTSYNWISFGYVVLGLVFLFWPELSLMTLCYAFGILTIVYGIVHLIGYFVRDRLISVFRYDPVLLGIFIILSSIMKIQNAIDLKRVDYPRWWLILVFALISIALGAILIWNPFAAASTLMMFVGASLCADGIMSLWSMFCLTRSVRRVEKKLKEEEEYRNMERVDGEVVEDTDLTDRW